MTRRGKSTSRTGLGKNGNPPPLAVPGLDDIRAAAKRIADYVHRTPAFASRSIDDITGSRITFKCENLQKVGAFKMRGATNAIAQLDAQQRRLGVATHSSGNHGAALALAARNFRISAHVVMPETAPLVKKRAVAGYGAKISYCSADVASRDAMLAEVIADTGATVIHPYNDPRIIAGQGTASLELLEDCGEFDMIVVPLGGGGLISGTAITVKSLYPGTRVIGVEPAGAEEALLSLKAGELVTLPAPRSIADGLLAPVSELTFSIIRERVDEVVAVTEADIMQAMRLLWERMKIIVEPSGAVALAAILAGKVDSAGHRVGIILSGGNVDLDALPWVR